jgi:hypothetical protein
MKEDRPNIVQMSIQSKQTSASLIGPDLDFIIISTRNEEGLRFVKVDSSNGSIMLLKSVNQGPHAVIP